jgi:hypothetical protein
MLQSVGDRTCGLNVIAVRTHDADPLATLCLHSEIIDRVGKLQSVLDVVHFGALLGNTHQQTITRIRIVNRISEFCREIDLAACEVRGNDSIHRLRMPVSASDALTDVSGRREQIALGLLSGNKNVRHILINRR